MLQHWSRRFIFTWAKNARKNVCSLRGNRYSFWPRNRWRWSWTFRRREWCCWTPSSWHKIPKSEGNSSFSLWKTDEKISVVMKVIDNITLKEARKEGMLSLDNVQMVFGKNCKHVLKLYLFYSSSTVTFTTCSAADELSLRNPHQYMSQIFL